MDDGTSQREKDEQAIVRVFTSDREYCVDMMNRLFVNDTEQSQLMTTRLLESIYACKQEDLYTQGLSKTRRVQHYMEQTKWLAETCNLYLNAVKQVVSVEGRGAVLEQWQEWEQALGEEAHGEENDRPETVEGMLKELSAIMHPDVHTFPWRGGTVQERRLKYRENRRWHAARDSYPERECERHQAEHPPLLNC